MPLWSQGEAREGEAESRQRSEANVGRGKAELFPLRGVDGGIHGLTNQFA